MFSTALAVCIALAGVVAADVEFEDGVIIGTDANIQVSISFRNNGPQHGVARIYVLHHPR